MVYKSSMRQEGGGGGAVDSVNGQTGVVVLDATDVGALAIDGSNADQNVDIGAYALNAASIKINGTNGAGHIHFKRQAVDATSQANSTTLFVDSAGDLKWKNGGLYYTTIMTSGNTANRIYTFPNTSGTVSIISAPTNLTTTGNINNQATLTGWLVFSGTASVTLTGLTAPAADGTEVIITNNDTTNRSFTIVHQSASSSAANRIICPNATSMSIKGGFSVKLKYDLSVARWYIVEQVLIATSPLLINGSNISIQQATSTSAGYLAQADWIGFNGKPNISYSNIDYGAVIFSTGSPATYPAQLASDKDFYNYNDVVKGVGINIARNDIKAANHLKTPPSSIPPDVPTGTLSFQLEIPAGSTYSQTANMDIPYIQRAIGVYISPISGASTFTAGDVLDYQIWAYDDTGTYSACAGTVQQTVSTSGDEMQIYWSAGSMVNTLAGFKIIRQINGTGFTDAIDVGNVTSYTDAGFTGGDLTITPTADDFVSNGTTWTFTPSGVNVSPSGGIYKSATGSTYGFYDNNTGDAYRIYHNVYAYGPSTGIFVTDGVNSYLSASYTFYQDTTTFTAISTPPEHYGILSDGSNLNWDINLYERQVIDGRAYYSVTPYNLTNADLNTGQYLYATIAVPYFEESIKILMSVNGGGDASAISSAYAYDVDAFNFPFSGNDTITPNNVYKAVQILEQQAESEDDPSALIIKGLNGFQSVDFQDAAGNRLAKMIVGTDGSVDFICSSLKVNGVPV